MVKRIQQLRQKTPQKKFKGNNEMSLKHIDEEISSSEDEMYKSDVAESSENESEEETADMKRKRMAKEYLATMANDDDNSDSDDDHEEVAERLRKNRLDLLGKLFRPLAEASMGLSSDGYTQQKLIAHSNAVTCLALSSDEKTLFSGSKDNSIIGWALESGKRFEIKPKWNQNEAVNSKDGEILAIAISHDGRYLASGGRDNKVRIYDGRANFSEVQVFTGHRDAVTSLTFRRDSYSLFSGSLDRCIKHWDLNEMGYIETMFGHQDGINAMDCWVKEKPVSSSSDRTVRVWKVAEESHLVFRGHKSNVDVVQILTDDHVVSAGQDGSLNLWKESQKHPICTVANAHGFEAGTHNPRWISSLAAVKMSDLVATGSSDGFIRLWKVSVEDREITLTVSIPCDGFVNALVVTANMIVAGTGREHRLGRWGSLKGNKNKIINFRFKKPLE